MRQNIVHIAVTIFALMGAVNASAAQKADTIITNATIYGHPHADTLAIKDGLFLYIGSEREAGGMFSPETEIIDAEGAFVMPGFIDNHNHVFEAASQAAGVCELSGNALLKGQIPYLKKCRAEADSDNWLLGYGFSLDTVLSEENRETPLQVLDAIFPDQPVILMEQTSHSMWVNSLALDLAGISKSTPRPQGGRILKDSRSGELNGILLDNAGDLVMEQAWNSISNQFELSYQGLMAGLEEAAANGITTIGDGRMYWKRGWFDIWQAAEQQGELTARVSVRPWIYPSDKLQTQLAYLKSIQSDDPSRLLLVDQVKMYSDGIIINGTAKILQPYRFSYLKDAPYGLNYIPMEQMKVWLRRLDQIGYSAHIHAIGDGAVRESLDAIEYVRDLGADKPYTLTHIELVNKQDRQRFSQLKVSADFQVGSDYIVYHDHQWAEAFIGAQRARNLMNLRALFNTGANVTLSSDWDVNSINPLVGIANSLKMGKTGLPDIDSAIRAYTINAARSLGLDAVTGSIEVGKSADLVMLDSNITRLAPDVIADAQVLMTLLQGRVVFEAEY
ncbi:amidohydrolase [Vibrio sp. SCSIO 43137]|uniref:amidohydrolase n=1 Tax=Vibrio sp. SCSIO 43137 TaxID=3021011 RepID=UPI003FCE31E7